MNLTINGENRSLPPVETLHALVEQLGMKSDRVAIELNREIVPREQWAQTPLKDGDRLEIVHFVGGGSSSGTGTGTDKASRVQSEATDPGSTVRNRNSRAINSLPQKSFAIRLVVTVAALAIWFWTQSLIGARNLPGAGIGDGVQAATASANFYLQTHPFAANALLIASSAIIDLLGVFLLSKWLFRGSARPFIALVIVLGLRQIMQAMVALPAPPNAIWHYPGFPSLLVTYGVSNDYFFSGHTAIAVLGATELVRLRRRWLTALGVGIVAFEVLTVLILRAHYTMDVFTGLVTGLYAAHLASYFSERFAKRWRS
jgi:thiamine biosynthesis protein ThiS